jgi:bifunctional DNA-binding transcriptional regulator/antitoxin component of YhaV-PrlF toxin-antitoxin module
MTVAVKNDNKTPLVVPTSIRRQARFKSGQELEFRVSGGVITIVPKRQNTDEEYTPEQRRSIDRKLAEGLADIESGRTHGPFQTAEDMIAHMKRQLRTRSPRKSTKPSR